MGAHALGCLIGLVVILACLEHIVDVVQPALACSLLFDSLGESEVAVDPSLEMAFRSDDDIEVFPVLVNEDVAKAAEGLIVPDVRVLGRLVRAAAEQRHEGALFLEVRPAPCAQYAVAQPVLGSPEL